MMMKITIIFVTLFALNNIHSQQGGVPLIQPGNPYMQHMNQIYPGSGQVRNAHNASEVAANPNAMTCDSTLRGQSTALNAAGMQNAQQRYRQGGVHSYR